MNTGNKTSADFFRIPSVRNTRADRIRVNLAILKISVIILTLTAASSSYAEFIFLKDGNIIEGKIISDSADSIVLKKKDGNKETISRSVILRTMYANLNMSKLYVQKRDGNSFVAYLVDEDRDDYVFRKEFNQPQEFTVSRKEVLFMSEKNPSALKGDVASNSVALSWLPPYGQVKVYRVYMKSAKDAEYNVIGSTKKNNITITGLESQKTYFFIVRAIDDTDYETNPSNEIQIITKSSLPGKPDVAALQDEQGSWVLSWDKPSDKDGEVEKYRVYAEKNDVYALLEETENLTVVVPQNTVFDSIHVRAVDNNGDESEAVDYRHDWRFALSPLYCIPTGKMQEISGDGYGLTLDVSHRDIFFNDFETGLSAGYVTLDGKKKIGEGNSDVTSLEVLPVAAFAGYRIPLYFNKFGHYDIISFFPKLSAGVLVVKIDYDLLDNDGSVDESKKASIYEPFIKAGLVTESGFSRNFYITMGCEYSYMIDSIHGLGMIILSFSGGFRF